MKNLLVIAMALVSVSAFAADHHDTAANKAAVEACAKEHHADKTKMAACVTEKMKAAVTAPATTPATTTTAPAVKK